LQSVDSDIDDISSDIGTGRFSLSHGIGKKTFGSGISNLDADDIDDSISSVVPHRFGPSAFESHDESDDLLEHDKHYHHDHEHEEKHLEKGKESAKNYESNGEEESSKGYKVRGK
jgi:Mg-chelatase subunit ChlI